MALSDLIRRPAASGAAGLAATVARLATEKQAAADALQAARERYGDALVDAAEGREDPATLAKLKAAVAEAEDKAGATAAALVMAQARHRAAQDAEQRDQAAKAWDKAVALADKRQTAVRGLSDAMGELAEAYAAYVAATAELSAALPAVPDTDAALLRRGAVESAMLTELAKLGLNLGDTTSPSILHSTPSFLDRFAGLSEMVRTWRDSKGAV